MELKTWWDRQNGALVSAKGPCFFDGWKRWVLGMALSLSLAWPAGAAESGEESILLGQVGAFTGNIAMVGIGMRDGVNAAFKEANERGGVRGRQLELLSLDDKYEPLESLVAMKSLITNGRIVALVGCTGSPTLAATLSLINNAKIPLVGSFSGLESLYAHDKSSVFQIRPSYHAEIETIVDHLIKDLEIQRISIFYQNDTFGLEGLEGLKKSLEKRGLTLASAGSYVRNTVNVRSGFEDIEKGHPEAIILVATYGPCIKFVEMVRQRKLDVTLAAVSGCEPEIIAKQLGAKGQGVYATLVVPWLTESTAPVVDRYTTAMKAAHLEADIGSISLEGYIAGRLIVEILNALQGEINRANFLQTVDRVKDFDIDGFKLSYNSESRGSSKVYLTEMQADSTLKPVDKFHPLTHTVKK